MEKKRVILIRQRAMEKRVQNVTQMVLTVLSTNALFLEDRLKSFLPIRQVPEELQSGSTVVQTRSVAGVIVRQSGQSEMLSFEDEPRKRGIGKTCLSLG